jgi:hypothetical protein
VRAVVAALLLGCTAGGFAVGLYAGQQAALRDARSDSETFQQCVVALLFLKPDDRPRLTDDRVAEACQVDVEKVHQVRDKLRG